MQSLPNGGGSLSGMSLAGSVSSSVPEEYIELWWYSGGIVSTTASFGGAYLQKGSTSAASANTGSAVLLHTLNANWNPNNKYALEITLYANVSGVNANAYLYDLNTSSTVGTSQTTTTATTATVIRSGQFTLTPGHKYAVVVGYSGSSGTTYYTDASLIVFPS